MATNKEPVVTKVLNDIIRAHHLFTKKEVWWLLKKHKLDRHYKLHKLISPDHLLLSFANYLEEATERKRIPTVVGFASYVGVSLQYLRNCRRGTHDVPSFTVAELAAKTKREQYEIQTLFKLGKAALADRNYSDVVNMVFTKCENFLINRALDANGRTNAKIAEFLLKNHFNYTEKVEQTVTSHQNIKLVNDIPPDAAQTVEVTEDKFNFLVGDNDDAS